MQKTIKKITVNFNIKCILKDIEALVIAGEISDQKRKLEFVPKFAETEKEDVSTQIQLVN